MSLWPNLVPRAFPLKPFFKRKALGTMVGHSFRNLWHDIRAVFSHVYLQSFLTRYTCVFLSRILAFYSTYMTIFLQTRIYMRTKKSQFICVTNKHVVYAQPRPQGFSLKKLGTRLVYADAESRRIRGTELYRQQKTPSCTTELKSNCSLNQAWPARVNFEQDLVLIHCPHSSGGCWLPDKGFVGIRGMSLEKLCTLFHKCWPKQRSIQLEISVRQAKHNS